MDGMAQQIKNLTPQQRQAVLMQAQNEANMKIRAELLNKMVAACYDKCAGTSGDQLDSRELSCLASCHDRYLETRAQVQSALQQRQQTMGSM
mmetsp:Transcript_35757/g.74400  ORF Transcript_35757/g.74400 Transcript_35757/m.74400 type:complete len:92 (+) Transcript_35757:101-376(+)|eukprot:CAMPEP_0172452668 /NCGR_PEP_ID=MMETSP1065-20121228/10260_1 /TAXON_ID=265537 /ORGANISM="Amphiprora paludosa, Strain CCMP125" /LENGTH=91 /DNA_ID=CAMNT_0013204763 /DNA_START=78 /DNA_END=353 /DNA_ORIENTATION=-